MLDLVFRTGIARHTVDDVIKEMYNSVHWYSGDAQKTVG